MSDNQNNVADAAEEMGTCEVCGAEHVDIHRTYFRYRNIKCMCHSPYHFVIAFHCPTCVPKPPVRITVEIAPDIETGKER